MEDKKVMKNMEYWKKKNNIPGIEALKDSGLTDGRAGSSPFQLNPVMTSITNVLDKVKKPQTSSIGGVIDGGVGNTNDALSTKIDEKIDEKVEQAVSGDDGSGLTMKSPIYAGVETKEARGEMMGDIDKVDPDAPGTKGKPGYEPPVKRSELDAKGKAIFDKNNNKQEDSAQDFENIKNDHDVDDNGIPQTDPEGYWKKAAKHGIYPKGKSPSKIYSKEGAPGEY